MTLHEPKMIEKDTDQARYKVPSDLVPLLRAIDTIHEDPANARENHDIAGIAGSLRKYGQRTPLVVNADGTTEKGNGTLKAARSIGWTHIPVVNVDDDPVTAAGYSIVDNELGDKSQFNLERLKTLTDSIPQAEELPGFDMLRLEEIRAMCELDEPPSLDDLASEYGEPQERDFWPMVRVQVSPETFDMFNSFMEQTGIEDEALAFERVIGAVDAAVLGSL